MTVIASVILVLAGVGACDVPLRSDLNRDCVVNFKDVQAMAEQWLAESGLDNLGGDDRIDMLTLRHYRGTGAIPTDATAMSARIGGRCIRSGYSAMISTMARRCVEKAGTSSTVTTAVILCLSRTLGLMQVRVCEQCSRAGRSEREDSS